MKIIKKTTDRSPSENVVFMAQNTKVTQLSWHFIGIGGCGMSGLAQVLKQRGHTVTGSDVQSSEVTDKLITMGIKVSIGHCIDNITAQLDHIVISAAVKWTNPEVMQAKRIGIQIYKYAELLGHLSREIKTSAIAGTHGKSTTSGWLSYLLVKANVKPNFVIGADVAQLNGASSGAGSGDCLVVESCEYDRSFLNLSPFVATLLNIEADHLDYYSGLSEIMGAFSEFTNGIVSGGTLIGNGDDPNTVAIVNAYQGNSELYAINDKRALWKAKNLSYETGFGCFEIMRGDQSLGRVKLSLPGAHNVSNALAVAANAWHCGVPAEAIIFGLETFSGVGRRLSDKGEFSGVRVIDDYAHHPTEIKVTLEAIVNRYQPKRLWCVFQPHQHSRTRFLIDDFAVSFNCADFVLAADIYFVRDSEDMRKEINAETLIEKISQNGGNCLYLPHFDHIVDYLQGHLAPGDLVVTMGAGDVWKISDELICRLRRNSKI